MDLLLRPHARIRDSAAEQAWTDMVVKCMIKVTKSLPQTISVRSVLMVGYSMCAA